MVLPAPCHALHRAGPDGATAVRPVQQAIAMPSHLSCFHSLTATQTRSLACRDVRSPATTAHRTGPTHSAAGDRAAFSHVADTPTRRPLRYLADRLHAKGVPMLINVAEGAYDLSLRSSPARAKKALAVRSISVARRSSLTSRSGSSMRLTHSSTVCAVPLIFGAINSTAAHNDGYCRRYSWAIRTTRSRTSGENWFEVFMAPYSQELEPPQNPRWLISAWHQPRGARHTGISEVTQR